MLVWLATLFSIVLNVNVLNAAETAIENVQFSSLSGKKMQLRLKVKGDLGEPKIFQTDNPARLALDFANVKSHLAKKHFPVNQGVVNSVYVIEAGNRTRVIVNLYESVTYKTQKDGGDFYLVVNAIKSVAQTEKIIEKQVEQKEVGKLIPKQTIKAVDFRRGTSGEGRLLLSLSSSNTVVDIKEKGDKVILNFLNTHLPQSLAKQYDVIDFATPVRLVDVKQRGSGASVVISTIDGNYDYSSFQSEGLLTVEFRPLTFEEKEELKKEKFPFSGAKLSLNFQDIEVRSVLQILSDFTELNIIASDSVGGSVTLRLNDVPWDQALALVLKSKGLEKRESGNVIYIAPAAEIIEMEEKELQSKQVKKQLEPLRTEYIQIRYAKAEEIQQLITGTKAQTASSGQQGGARGGNGGRGTGGGLLNNREPDGLLSYRGTSIVDSRTNTLIVRDTVKQLEEINKMISLLDIPIRQVLIEARIVIANTDFARNLGVKFGVAKPYVDIGSGKQFAFGGGGTNTVSNAQADESGNFGEINDTLVDLAAAGIQGHPVGALGMTLARGADYVLNLELTALENNGGGEVLSNPRVITVDRAPALIKQGVQIPFATVSQDGTQTELKDAVLELNVTPQITPNGEVIMELLIKKDSPDQATGGIQKREVSTNVQVKDGETVVLGGIYEQTSGQNNFKVPFFGDLPGLDFLFRKKEISDNKTEMLIFVTPKIIKHSLAGN